MNLAHLGKNLKYTNKLTVRWVFPRPGLKLTEIRNKCYNPPNLLQTLMKKKKKKKNLILGPNLPAAFAIHNGSG